MNRDQEYDFNYDNQKEMPSPIKFRHTEV